MTMQTSPAIPIGDQKVENSKIADGGYPDNGKNANSKNVWLILMKFMKFCTMTHISAPLPVLNSY